MGALRQLATESFAYPRSIARIVTGPRTFWLVYAGAAVLLSVLVATAGAFSPGHGPLRHEHVANRALVPFFSAFTVLALCSMVVRATRAWSAWHRSSLWAVRPRTFRRALRLATADALAHPSVRLVPGETDQAVGPRRRRLRLPGPPGRHHRVCSRRAHWAHVLSTTNPLKVLGNVSAALVIGGTACFLVLRSSTR